MVALEDARAGREPYHAFVDLLSPYMLRADSDDGELLPEADAREILLGLTLDDLAEALNQFTEGIERLQAATVPPASSDR